MKKHETITVGVEKSEPNPIKTNKINIHTSKYNLDTKNKICQDLQVDRIGHQNININKLQSFGRYAT